MNKCSKVLEVILVGFYSGWMLGTFKACWNQRDYISKKCDETWLELEKTLARANDMSNKYE